MGTTLHTGGSIPPPGALLCCAGEGTLAHAAQTGCGVSSLEISKSHLDMALGSLLWMSLLEWVLDQMDPEITDSLNRTEILCMFVVCKQQQTLLCPICSFSPGSALHQHSHITSSSLAESQHCLAITHPSRCHIWVRREI